MNWLKKLWNAITRTRAQYKCRECRGNIHLVATCGVCKGTGIDGVK